MTWRSRLGHESHDSPALTYLFSAYCSRIGASWHKPFIYAVQYACRCDWPLWKRGRDPGVNSVLLSYFGVQPFSRRQQFCGSRWHWAFSEILDLCLREFVTARGCESRVYRLIIAFHLARPSLVKLWGLIFEARLYLWLTVCLPSPSLELLHRFGMISTANSRNLPSCLFIERLDLSCQFPRRSSDLVQDILYPLSVFWHQYNRCFDLAGLRRHGASEIIIALDLHLVFVHVSRLYHICILFTSWDDHQRRKAMIMNTMLVLVWPVYIDLKKSMPLWRCNKNRHWR